MNRLRAWRFRTAMALILVAAASTSLGGGTDGPAGGVCTDIEDFKMPGNQPTGNSKITDPLVRSTNCAACHDSDGATFPMDPWRHSPMGQASRDPVFLACLDIANADVPQSGDLCIRCHSPIAWLSNKSINPGTGEPDMKNFTELDPDFDGVSCSFCHRMMNPVTSAAEPQPRDPGEIQNLTDLGLLPAHPNQIHNGTFIVDRQDWRRGPYDVTHTRHRVGGGGGRESYNSQYFRSSALCGSCHDVSNPVFERQPDGTYDKGACGTPHINQNKFDMFPIERTFSEWSKSEFAQHTINLPRFGGNNPNVSTCQDCHMPKDAGRGCTGTGGQNRPDNAQHFFTGSNSWILKAVKALDTTGSSGLTVAGVTASIARAEQMMKDASDMVVYQDGDKLVVRIINMCGHKLPTGYPEGRQMWIHATFLDTFGLTIEEYGEYNSTDGVNDEDTKVYEAHMGYDDAVAADTGLPVDHEPNEPATESFHFVANNVLLKDNRIPPRGFSNGAFQTIQAAPVGATYADGQYWDDTEFVIPANPNLDGVVVQVYHQTTTPKYITFLKDKSPTFGQPGSRGKIAYDQWVAQGHSQPMLMDETNGVLLLAPPGAPTVRYVDDTATGANNGTSWTDAFTTLQAALAVAFPSNQIWVAQGTYYASTINDWEESFQMKSGVSVYGGFAGGEANLSDRAGLFKETILTGDIGTAGDNTDNCYHVVEYNSTTLVPATLDGFTITGGNADANGNVFDSKGGGVALHGSGFFNLRNCIVVGNECVQYGAGLYSIMLNGSLEVSNCVFSGNGTINVTTYGGALFADQGAHTRIINSSMSRNEATATGGVYNEIGAAIVMTNTVLWGNLDTFGDPEDAQLGSFFNSATINYCIIEGWSGFYGGIGNSFDDPLFRDSDGGDNTVGTVDDDLRVGLCSPAIDSGHSTAVPAVLVHDLSGSNRFEDDDRTIDLGDGSDPIVDRGAYEFAEIPCNGDTNLDQVVDIDDWTNVTNNWSNLAFPCEVADVNNDGIVDIDDLTIVVLSWGPCP